MKKVSLHFSAIIVVLLGILSLSVYANVNEDLLSAAKEGNLASVKKALNSGARLNATAYGGKTALILAALNENADVAAFLIQQGADVSVQDDDGKTALMYAVEMIYALEREEGDTKLAKQLITDTINKVTKPLIEKGAEVNIKDKNGKTALMGAVQSGNIEAAKLLIEHGADVNAQDKDGSSVLRWALILEIFEEDKQTCIDMFKLLIESGADVNAKNKEGKTILMQASLEEIIDLLKKAGAK